ncbi:hypothetical protein BH10ACI4_BH10ACI4_33270 [soil metagenome]
MRGAALTCNVLYSDVAVAESVTKGAHVHTRRLFYDRKLADAETVPAALVEYVGERAQKYRVVICDNDVFRSS